MIFVFPIDGRKIILEGPSEFSRESDYGAVTFGENRISGSSGFRYASQLREATFSQSNPRDSLVRRRSKAGFRRTRRSSPGPFLPRLAIITTLDAVPGTDFHLASKEDKWRG